eukprot:scaffold18526_cov69-Phaeocystis_antarctica.AAC.1
MQLGERRPGLARDACAEEHVAAAAEHGGAEPRQRAGVLALLHLDGAVVGLLEELTPPHLLLDANLRQRELVVAAAARAGVAGASRRHDAGDGSC